MTPTTRPTKGFQPTAKPLCEDSQSAANQPATRSRDFRCTCPNCGSELWDKECKSRCPRCHFFSDCSDPW